MKSAIRFFAVVITFVLLGTMAAPPGLAQDQSTQNPPPAQNPPQQDQSQQGQTSDKDQQKKKKKGGGFFSGLKAVSGSGSEQQEATRTAGSKTVGEGAQIGDAQPTADDRKTVQAMEAYSIPAPEVKKFQEDGKLKPKQ